MNLFINDIPVRLVEETEKLDKRDFNHVINPDKEPITKAKLLNRVWIKYAKEQDIDNIIELLDSNIPPRHLIALTLTVVDYKGIKKFLKNKFKIIKAGGGLVTKGEKILMIYRMKKWDLPKGKQERYEDILQTAWREVQEECSIAVEVQDKLCTTWHTYTMKKKRILKKTVWYNMMAVKTKGMKPQVEEDIEEVRWMTRKEAYHALQNSYKSIAFVFDEFYKKEKRAEIED